MKLARTTTTAILLLATIGFSAHAEAPKTREQVKAELAEAIRTGDVLAPGEVGLKLNELYPSRYPKPTAAAGKTREKVKAELAEAIRAGDVVAAGEAGLTLRELSPQRYPSVAVAAGKTRSQVKAETVEAIRTGDIIANSESGLRLNEEFPQRYAKQRATYTAEVKQPDMAASATSR